MKNKYLSLVYAVLLTLGAAKVHSQYTVSAIPSQQYPATLPLSFTADDLYSAVIPLNFDFDFFGNSYNSVVVSTNGHITFDPSLAGMTAIWGFNSTIPNAGFPIKNSFLGCYHDMNNADGDGTITFGSTGMAPYRKFVVMYNNNSHFQCNTAAKTTLQMVLYETLNVMDTQIIRKDLCATWNNGNAVVGVINADGLVAFTPPGRNTSQWTALNEAWRFAPEIETGRYDFVKCDDDADGFSAFNLGVAQTDLGAGNPGGVTFHLSESDAIGQANPLAVSYTNLANPQTIYANANGQVVSVVLRVVDCDNDFDGDTAETVIEDVNADTNLANDDTDADGIPDFTDNDDDGDLVLTNEEYVFGRNANALLDTDNDGIPNYLDNDDDGDGVLTIHEDYNGNNDPSDDDTNGDGTPDYLQSAVALGVVQNAAQMHTVSLYPNPAADVLNIDNKTGQRVSEISIYTTGGAWIRTMKNPQPALSISDLPTGLYFVKIHVGHEIRHAKFLKN